VTDEGSQDSLRVVLHLTGDIQADIEMHRNPRAGWWLTSLNFPAATTPDAGGNVKVTIEAFDAQGLSSQLGGNPLFVLKCTPPR
jgi:hypothetical protein